MSCFIWGDLTRERIGDLAGAAVALLPVGAVEQHGPHLPTKTDAFIAGNVARAAAERTPDDVTALVLPEMPFGASEHHVPFGGTLSVSSLALTTVLVDLVRSVKRAGIERVLIVNGHGGNAEICGLVAKQTAIELDLLVAAASYWMTLPPDTDVPGHAGRFETSIMLHLAPALVVRSEFAESSGALQTSGHAGVVIEDPRHWRALGGWTDDPARSDADWGRRMFVTAAEQIAGIACRLARQKRPAGREES